MFNTSMLVVLRNEDSEAFTELEKLVNAEDDIDGEIVGVEDGSVRLVKCLESDWKLHKKAGRLSLLAEKFMFINIKKGFDKPDMKFNKYGVSYGYEGDTLLLSIDDDYVWTEEKYKQFLVDLKEISRSVDDMKNQMDCMKKSKTASKVGFIIAASSLLVPVVSIPATIVGAKKASNISAEHKALRQQRLLYGICQIYYNDLETFIKNGKENC